MSATPPPLENGPTATRSEPTPPRRRVLPVGPVGLFLITAVALLAAFGAARLMIALLDDEAVDVQDALDDSVKAPLVVNSSVRAEVGSPAPDVRLEFLDGGVQQLAEVAGRGTPVVLNFWSSTCVPCLKEMPAFEEVHQRFGDDLAVVGVDVTDSAASGNEMVAKTGVTYRNARDPRAEIFAVYGGIALPRTVVIGPDGVVLDTHSGELTVDSLTALLTEHDLVET